MLQLSRNQANNVIALYPDITISTGSTYIFLSGSQDYDRNPSSFAAFVLSTASLTPWVIAEFNGNLLPTASGFYTFGVYEYSIGNTLVWNTTNTQWQLTNVIWNDSSSAVIGDLLVTTRAFISGSDVTPITQYVSPDENGAYTTYLG
jgi:hypothetical protein